MLRRFFLFVFIALISLNSCKVKDRQENVFDNARYVWADETGTGRQEYLVFRRDFNLEGNLSGKINLFAWSRYHLNINGIFVNFGPARSYPASPGI